jgi:F1F0 ATPase subunit 2
MNEPVSLALALAAGVALGVVFFGGLWWTVRKGVLSSRPGFWVLGSLLVRMSITVAGFYFVSGRHWERFLLCLLGFVIARVLVTLRTRIVKKPPSPAQETGHAPQSR